MNSGTEFTEIPRSPRRIDGPQLLRRGLPFGRMPLVFEPQDDAVDLNGWVLGNRASLERDLLSHGAILFRGFRVDTPARLRGFMETISPNLVDYDERRSPRTDLAPKVYSSTVHPPHQFIHFHNTNSFSHRWPQKIAFNCIRPSEQGGRTPLADCRAVLRRLSEATRRQFMDLGVRYVRNFYPGIGLSWQTTFRVNTREELESHCRHSHIEFQWIGECLRTTQHRHAVIRHPATGELSWFNQAHHFHVRSLEQELITAIVDAFTEEQLPRNAYFGDGAPIDEPVLEEIVGAYEAERVEFDWARGDVLLIENMLVAHARTSFVGDRLIALTLADTYSPPLTDDGVV